MVARTFTTCFSAGKIRDGSDGYGSGMSIEVPIDQLFEQVDGWGFGYLLTVSDGGRPHLIALRPIIHGERDGRRLRFDADGRRACRNAAARPDVSIVFPPGEHSDGYSLVVDGTAIVVDRYVDVRPTSAVLHRPAP